MSRAERWIWTCFLTEEGFGDGEAIFYEMIGGMRNSGCLGVWGPSSRLRGEYLEESRR